MSILETSSTFLIPEMDSMAFSNSFNDATDADMDGEEIISLLLKVDGND